jgi:hypothetical protein
MHLPVELLLIICYYLGPAERRSLSCTCRAMFAFINMKAPFRNLRLTRGGTWELISLHRHARVLAFASEVYWNPGNRRMGSHHSANPLSVPGQSIRIVLSTLQTSSTLRLFEICHLKVSPSHQRIILSVPTLRELILNRSIFVPSATKMPSSSITTLAFVPSAFQPAPAAHVLRLLSESLEALDVGFTTRTVYATLSTTRFPRLVSLRQRSLPNPNTLDFFICHLSITRLYISVRISYQPLNFPPEILPLLRDLSAPWWVAEQLVPGRPVQVFSDTGSRAVKLEDLDAKLLQLAQSTRDIEELQMYTRFSAPRIFLVLAKHLPRLKRLKLRSRTNKLVARPGMGKGAKWTQLKERPLAITDLDIQFRYPMPGSTVSQISRHFCHFMLYLTAKACRVLEVASFAALDAKNPDVEERDIPSVWKFKACRTPMGKWEEQRESPLTSEAEGALGDSPLNIVSKTTLFVYE